MARRTREPHATSAWYDAADARVVMELAGGYRVDIPIARLKEIAGAHRDDLEPVELLGGGNVLHWDRLDADYSVPALILEMIGRPLLAREAARAAGKAKSPLKAAAARKNGKKGGRPRRATKR